MAAAFLGEHVGDGAHLAIPVGAADPQQLTELVHLIDPSPEIAVAIHQAELYICFHREATRALRDLPADFHTGSTRNPRPPWSRRIFPGGRYGPGYCNQREGTGPAIRGRPEKNRVARRHS